MKRLSLLSLACLTFVLFINSCTNDVITEGDIDIVDNKNVEYEEALNNVLTFNGGSGTKADESITIKSSSVQTYSYKLGGVKTKSSGQEIPDSASINIFTFVIEKDGSEGFAIASGDERISRVYAYTENGQLSDTSYIGGLAYTLSMFPYIYEQELTEYYTNDNITTKAASQTYLINIGPNVITKWGQKSPYNLRCPAGSTCTNTLVGCGGIAAAQALAYLNPAKIMSGVDYSLINSSPSPSEVNQEDMAALLCFNVAYGIGTTFGCSGSSIPNIKKTNSYLGSFNINTEYNEGNLKINNCINSIALNGITIASGVQKKGDKTGHVWLYDGVKGNFNLTGDTSRPYEKTENWPIFHCNWGWEGKSDGWYLSGYWESPSSKQYGYIANNEQIYIWGVTR